jgi:hypothetical protein
MRVHVGVCPTGLFAGSFVRMTKQPVYSTLTNQERRIGRPRHANRRRVTAFSFQTEGKRRRVPRSRRTSKFEQRRRLGTLRYGLTAGRGKGF